MLRSQKSQETVKSEPDKAWLMIFGSLQVKTATTNNKITLSFCVFFLVYIPGPVLLTAQPQRSPQPKPPSAGFPSCRQKDPRGN